MHSLAATTTPAAAPAIPIEWITSGAVTPVGSPVNSPAAAVQTGWSPQPVYVDPMAGNGSILDAIASSIMGPPQAHVAVDPQQQLALQHQAAMQQQAAVQQQQAAMQQQQLAMQAVAPPAAPVNTAAPMAAPAPTALAAPAAGAMAAPQDPTLLGSVSGAVAGFASAVGNVTGSGVSKAKRVGNELWAGVRSPRAIHVSQVPSKYNAAPAAGNKDCGPASVVMTLKLLGKSIPGAAGNAAPQKLINRVRQLAGNAANTASTTNHELGRALRAAGTQTREIADGASIRQAVLSGKPVILNGNPRNAGSYGPNFSASQMTPYSGAHWIVVSGFDAKAGKYIINDPLSKVGPVKVSPAQLESYRGGSMGIEVSA